MKSVFSYSDLHDKPVELSSAEIGWFQQKVQVAKEATGCRVPIYAYNFDLLKHSDNSLGFTFTDNRKNPADSANTYIAIDTYYIHECYLAEMKGDRLEMILLNGATLTETICHEIAHLTHWNHGKRHEVLTLKYRKMTEELEDGRLNAEAC